MKYRIPISVFTMVTVSIACGPFLAETILDRPRSVLDSRYGAFGFEMAVIDQQRNGNPTNLLASSRPEPVAFESFDAGKQLDTEVTELRDWWGAQGLKPEQVDALIERYRTWRELSRSVDLFGPYGVRSEPKETKPFPDSSALPGDVQLYLRGAQSYRAGDTTAARRIWTELLDLPAEQRRLRSTWAAWMLAKTSASAADALPWYQRVTDLRENEQCTDALNLSAAALGWRAAFTEDPVEKLKLYFDGAAAGCTRLLVDVHKIARDIGQGTDATLSARAAADPLVQQIVTATLLNGGRDDPASGTLPWVEFLENSGANEIANASRLAWLRYQQADFDQARKWVSLARKDDPSALWLRAKLALRDGDPDLAASQFARAISYYRPINEEHFSEFDGYGIPWSDTDTVTELMRRQFIADYGMTLVARAEFINAVDWLDRGGYHQDAEYLAEQVLTTDELLSWVERRFPQWHEPTPEDEQENAYGWNGIFHGDTWRYLTGRRLARHYRFKEARPFILKSALPDFDRYVILHRAGRSGKYSGDSLAAILWEKAHIHYRAGMELFGYEASPDAHRYGGAFPLVDIGKIRRLYAGEEIPVSENESWRMEGAREEAKADAPVPLPIHRFELQRLARRSAIPPPRFHYRFRAAEIAWQAAEQLPDNHPALAYIYNTAGSWLKYRDPQSADRFYKAMVWRNLKTDHGLEADRKRWFINIPAPAAHLMPQLPAELGVTSDQNP